MRSTARFWLPDQGQIQRWRANTEFEPSYLIGILTNSPTVGRTMTQHILDMPWRITNEMRRYLAWPYIRCQFFLHGVQWGSDWRIFGMPIIQRHRGSKIVLGNQLELRSWVSSNPLAPYHPVVLATRKPTARIEIGDHCGLTGATLVAAESIRLGNRVLVGANSTIVDTDFHPLHPHERLQDISNGKHRPVIIGDDVFLGMNCLILKGVTVGRGSVIGAGSVVVSDVPAGVVVAGNPAQILRTL